MKRTDLLILPLLLLAPGYGAFAVGAYASEDAPEEAPKEKPELPGVTKVDPGTDIRDIKSDTFKMLEAKVDGDVLKIKVSYSGGTKDHDFTLYWNQIVARSYPGRTTINLKHDAHGDAGEALITRTLEFDLTAITKPMIIAIRTDHGDKLSVKYGESGL